MIYITLLPTHHFLLTQQTLPLHTSLCLWFIFSDQKWILTGQGDEERKINKKCNNHDHNHQPITDIPHGPPLNLGRKTPPEVELETIIPYDYRYKKSLKVLDSAQFSHSVDPMDCSMPGFPVHYQLPELAQTHVHQVGDVIQPSHPLSPSPAFNLSQHQDLFQESVLLIRWPKYWSFSFSISPSNEY